MEGEGYGQPGGSLCFCLWMQMTHLQKAVGKQGQNGLEEAGLTDEHTTRVSPGSTLFSRWRSAHGTYPIERSRPEMTPQSIEKRLIYPWEKDGGGQKREQDGSDDKQVPSLPGVQLGHGGRDRPHLE